MCLAPNTTQLWTIIQTSCSESKFVAFFGKTAQKALIGVRVFEQILNITSIETANGVDLMDESDKNCLHVWTISPQN